MRQGAEHDLVRRHSRELFGFLHVDWPRLREQCPAAAEMDQSTQRLTAAWLDALIAHRACGARWTAGPRFHLAEFPADARATAAVRFAEAHYAALLRYLDGIAKPLQTAMPLLVFAQYDDFLSYHAAFDVAPEGVVEEDDDSELATAGGMFVDVGVPHILLPVNDEMEDTLAHELVHALVAHLPLPMWLNEGLAVAMEDLSMHGSSLPTIDDIAEHRARWTSATIQDFWSGASFRDPEWQRLSYQLAHGLLTTLARDYPRLVALTSSAHRDDAGASACRAVYGQDLGKLPQAMLGLGDWAPRGQ